MALAKFRGNRLCKKIQVGELRPLSADEDRIINQVKKTTLEVLQDALDKQMYGDPPSFHPTCTLDADPRRYCASFTETFLRQLVEKMNQVIFVEDPNPEDEGTIAYVYPDDESFPPVVHLCPVFWMLDDRLSKDSKPGTLIHEVSHFLGTDDVTYDFVCVETYEDRGRLMGAAVAYEEDEEKGGMKVHQILGGANTEFYTKNNANNIEYEFEIILNHRFPFSTEDQKYKCCGETKINSVCPERDIHYYIRGNK